MEDKLVTIAEFADSIEADLAKQKLDSSGIKSVLTGQNAANIYGIAAIAKTDLQVFENQAQEALKILQPSEKREQ